MLSAIQLRADEIAMERDGPSVPEVAIRRRYDGDRLLVADLHFKSRTGAKTLDK